MASIDLFSLSSSFEGTDCRPFPPLLLSHTDFLFFLFPHTLPHFSLPPHIFALLSKFFFLCALSFPYHIFSPVYPHFPPFFAPPQVWLHSAVHTPYISAYIFISLFYFLDFIPPTTLLSFLILSLTSILWLADLVLYSFSLWPDGNNLWIKTSLLLRSIYIIAIILLI